MRSLVLGGGGFIGSHVVDKLIAEGHQVRVFDRASRPDMIDASIEWYQGDFSETSILLEALYNVDVVYHLISTTFPATSNDNPEYDVQSNLVGTIRLLQHMIALEVKRIVFLSSGGTVYGIPETIPVTESHRVLPICSYGVVKAAIENYLNVFCHCKGIEYLSLRASNPFGPRQSHTGLQGVIGTFLALVSRGESIRVWGDGSVVRDYIYVEDLAKLCVLAGASAEVGTYNAGSGIGHSVSDIISLVKSVTGLPVRIERVPARSFDVPRIVLSIDKAKDRFGWEPETSIEKGMEATWRWYSSKQVQ